jgi:hypothetical protein
MVKGTDTLRTIVLVLLLAACNAPVPPSFSLGAGDPGRFELVAGRYRIAWTMGSCTMLRLWWVPATGEAETVTEIPIPMEPGATGSAVLELPAGPGYLDRTADCDDYRVSVGPA